MNMMQDKPVKAGLYQNHDAHMVVHSEVETAQSKAHIQDHMAMKFLIEMQNIMGVNLNEIDLNDPEVQNELALKAAQAVGQLKLNSGEGENSELDPNQLYAMDIHQKEEANKVKKEIAIMKQEGEAFKSQLHFEETKQRLKVEKEKIYFNIKAGIDDNEIIMIKEKGNVINENIKGDIKIFVKTTFSIIRRTLDRNFIVIFVNRCTALPVLWLRALLL
jgi:hypothetical protein